MLIFCAFPLYPLLFFSNFKTCEMKALKEVQEVCVLCHIYSKRVYAIVGGFKGGACIPVL